MALVRPSRLARALPFAALAPLLVACSEPTAVGALALKLGRPHFEGVLLTTPMSADGPWTAMNDDRPTRECGREYLISASDARTVVLRADGGRASVADLAVGRRVSVWFSTPILLSCTPSSTAGTIVLR